jgi:hypothetical protein
VLIPLVVGLFFVAAAGAARSSSSSSRVLRIVPIKFGPPGPAAPQAAGYDALSTQFAAAEALTDEQRKVREAAAEKEAIAFGEYGAKVADYFYMGGVYRWMWKYAVNISIAAGKALAGLVYSDPKWNSEENKKRAQAMVGALAARGFLPAMPIDGASDDFYNWGNTLQYDLDQLAAVERNYPGVWARWMDVVNFVNANPNDPTVRDVMAIPDGYKPSRAAYPVTLGAMQNQKPATAMAIATLAAKARGVPAEPVRRYAHWWWTEWQPKYAPELRLADHRGAKLAGLMVAISEAIDKRMT